MEVSTTVGERFSELISHLGISKNAFATSLEKTATVIQHIVDERNKPGFDLLCKVFEVYPNVSKTWVLQGVGPMLATDPAVATGADQATHRSRPMQSASPVAASTATKAPLPVAASASPVPKELPQTPDKIMAQDAIEAETRPDTVPAQPVPPSTAAAAAPISAEPSPAVVAVASVAAAPADTSWQTALYTQQMAHQLAMAELRNQHLQEQQRMMQQMMDLMKQQMFK
ncbi:helix-turn-helix transcriptional regulator [Hymenobacter elongatus]|uniref:XRE family transcriptional regulator n=1 Tax=Hymenobacter elongatus TaxID=877208 RepID=A0A4Z0PJJ0_9BACT|nr:helix-turn-helix transcriptional regulator [Hymenobacter elongatus]TGE14521.1 XRE family transcriptional regulator [Hymenobacter elongatus]